MREEKIFVNSFGERNRPPVLKPERVAFALIEKDRSELDKGRMDVTLPDEKLEICLKLGQQGLRQIFPDLVAEAIGARCSVREAWIVKAKRFCPNRPTRWSSIAGAKGGVGGTALRHGQEARSCGISCVTCGEASVATWVAISPSTSSGSVTRAPWKGDSDADALVGRRGRPRSRTTTVSILSQWIFSSPLAYTSERMVARRSASKRRRKPET